jgi:hypothetical protein
LTGIISKIEERKVILIADVMKLHEKLAKEMMDIK